MHVILEGQLSLEEACKLRVHTEHSSGQASLGEPQQAGMPKLVHTSVCTGTSSSIKISFPHFWQADVGFIRNLPMGDFE